MNIQFPIDIKSQIDMTLKNPDSGKRKFFVRLSKEFEKMGHKIVNTKPDIFISLPGVLIPSKTKLNVLRLNGLVFNKKWKYKKMNKVILKSIEKSNALIYQGKFCEKAYRKFLHIDKTPFEIIPNGVLYSEFLHREPKNFFLANGKWRPHKRLKTILESFLLALDMGLDSDLIVTGKPDYKIKHNRIKYVRWQNDDQLKKLLSGAIASLHLTWLDWCPNAMVEAIVAGCPIIYSDSGGHREMGIGAGILIEDTQWNFKPCDFYNPPSLDIKKIANIMLRLKNKNIVFVKNNKFDIRKIAKQYIDYFNRLMVNL